MDYSPEVEQRFAAPGRAGAFASDVPGVASGEAQDRALNVWIRFQVQVRAGIVEAARFEVYGCPHAIAAASWVAEWVEGRPAAALRQWDVREVAAALDVPVAKLGKLLRLQDAVWACASRVAARVPSEESKEG